MRLRFLLLALGLAAALRADPAPTVVTSDKLDADSTDLETTSVWRGNVVLTGTGIELHSDYLKGVVSGKGGPLAATGPYGTFRYMLATGHVRIVRDEYVATCGRAEMYPQEDRIVLTEDAAVKSPDGMLQGATIILYKDAQGHRHAEVPTASKTDLKGLKGADFGAPPAGDQPANGARPGPPPIQK